MTTYYKQDHDKVIVDSCVRMNAQWFNLKDGADCNCPHSPRLRRKKKGGVTTALNDRIYLFSIFFVVAVEACPKRDDPCPPPLLFLLFCPFANERKKRGVVGSLLLFTHTLPVWPWSWGTAEVDNKKTLGRSVFEREKELIFIVSAVTALFLPWRSTRGKDVYVPCFSIELCWALSLGGTTAYTHTRWLGFPYFSHQCSDQRDAYLPSYGIPSEAHSVHSPNTLSRTRFLLIICCYVLVLFLIHPQVQRSAMQGITKKVMKWPWIGCWWMNVLSMSLLSFLFFCRGQSVCVWAVCIVANQGLIHCLYGSLIPLPSHTQSMAE